VALVKPAEGIGAVDVVLRNALQTLALSLPPSQRPRRWLHCAQLQRNPLGKWARPHWSQWLASQPVPEP
jgi:O-succinylbenzoic acid--CoA ligase